MSTAKKATTRRARDRAATEALMVQPETTAALDTPLGPKVEHITEGQLFSGGAASVFLPESAQVEVGGTPSETAQEAAQDAVVVTLDIETMEPSDARAACQVSTSAALAALRMTLHHRRTETCE